MLYDEDKRSYSYYIETSLDQTNWNRVIDYTQYYCRSWQFLHFPSQAVRYIRLVGTHNTVNIPGFHVVALEAYHIAKVPELLNGLISPTHNVATPNQGASVIEGTHPNALINGDFKNYNSSLGFIYHKIGKDRNDDFAIKSYEFASNLNCFFLIEN